MHKAYYNEIDPKAAAWLRELIKQGLIAPGDVDERSIEDVLPTELAGYTQCHFFAGIGVWSHALRQAGWPDDRPVWTGSCPCQPFSAAGKRGGVDDERHLWPAFYWLISQCKPDVVFGEQVASKDGLAWLDTVQDDMEAAGYAIGAVDLCAASVGAPHIRQRLYFVAESLSGKEYASAEGRLHAESGSSGTVDELADAISLAVRSERPRSHVQETAKMEGDKRERVWADSSKCGTVGILEHAASDGRDARRAESDRRGITSGCGADILADSNSYDHRAGQYGGKKETGGFSGVNRKEKPCAGESGRASHSVRILGDAINPRLQGYGGDERDGSEPGRNGAGQARPIAATGPTNGFWQDAEWLYCRDDKYRAVEPGTFPLAHGVKYRVGMLHCFGDAIVLAQAAAAVESLAKALGIWEGGSK